MKTKYLLPAIGVLLVTALAWGGRVAWRIHKQLVTLDVRNMPLRDVLHKVERQTWKKIRAEKDLDARITLHVNNKSLTYVLDRIAEQSGARWSTVFAVYKSPTAVTALETSLRSDSNIDSAGWTKVAPKPPPMDQMPKEPSAQMFAKGLPGGANPAGGRRMMVMQRGPNGPVMMAGGPDGKMEMWSPEELVMETPLSTRLGDQDLPPSAQSAADAAKKLNSKWTTFFAFRKSPLGIGFRLPPVGGQGGLAGGPDVMRGPGGPAVPGRPEFNPMKHNPNDRFARLTAEQRVQQARDRQQRGGGQIIERRIEQN